MKFVLCSVLFLSLILSLKALDTVEIPEDSENPKEGKLWAVLVAGSSTWMNYRHQADVCHSYQVLKNHGIPDERIIVMMYDDLAKSDENPTPGIIINHPNGQDVYKGVPHDYTGEIGVTPENFMAVLRGDEKAVAGKGSGKVLQSGPNDHVFVYFADHGAPGLIAFPNSELTARDLNKTIAYMHRHKKYGKMVIYIEACESGSMFKNILPRNVNVYATTAANGDESSYACYYDEDRETYLGDLYSVSWLEDSDKEILTQETLLKQYKIVKQETNSSHVQEFGSVKIAQMKVSEFQGRKKAIPIVLPKLETLHLTRSRDVPVEIQKKKYMSSKSVDDQAKLLRKLNKIYRNRLFLSDRIKEIVAKVIRDKKNAAEVLEEHLELKDFDCYDDVREHFNNECFEISKNEYALDFLYVLVNLCEKKIPTRKIKVAMNEVCVHPPVHGIV